MSKAFFFSFFAWFRKINVYVHNTIHHRLKAEVIQEMIAGKIGFTTMYTYTLKKENVDRGYRSTWGMDPSMAALFDSFYPL